MIYVERHATDESGSPIRPNAAWFARAERATAKAIDEGSDHVAARAVFADMEVKKALERLFHDKCAYCETKMAATGSWDVEHFRPKGRPAERGDHPGYYWLAYAWENLYPSCQDCNRRRKDQPRWGSHDEGPVGGKAAQFPLRDESTRAMGPNDDICAEARLLIDPCIDDPEKYLGYNPLGHVFSVGGNPYGRTTIDVFHLDRRRLKDLRLETMRAVLYVLRIIKNLNEDAHSGAITEINAWIRTHYTGERCQHAGVARYVEKYSADFGL